MSSMLFIYLMPGNFTILTISLLRKHWRQDAMSHPLQCQPSLQAFHYILS